MADPRCSPEELARLARGISDDTVGEMTAESIISDTPSSTIGPSNETRRKMGFLGFGSSFRTMRGVWGDEFTVKAVNPTIKNNNQAENFVSKGYKQLETAMEPLGLSTMSKKLGISHEADTQLYKALGFIDDSYRYTGPAAAFKDDIIKTAQNIARTMDKIGEPYGIDRDAFMMHRKLLKDRGNGILREPTDAPADQQLLGRITDKSRTFHEELERKGIVGDQRESISAAFSQYMNTIASGAIRKPFFDRIEREYVNDFFNVRLYRSADGTVKPLAQDNTGWQTWQEYKHHIFGGPTPMDMRIANNLQRLGKMFGYEVDPRSGFHISQGVSSAFYAGVLGLRPASVIRQMFQLVPTYAELGARNTLAGLSKAMEPGNVQILRDMGILSSPIENLAQSVGIARSTGRAISEITETGLKVFSAVDQYVRSATAWGASAKFDTALETGIESLSARKVIKDQVIKLVEQGKVDDARTAYMLDTVANLQYIYGKANRPEVFRGALGNLMGILTSYPLNTFEMGRIFAQRAFKEGDPAPLLRLMTVTVGGLIAGSELLNADLRSAFMMSALPHSLAFPKMAMDTMNAGASNAEWLTGNLFMSVPESDYQRKERQEANYNFARNLRNFVPGGLFFFEDIPKAIDEGTLVRMLALTPKPDEINIRNKERMREKRQEATGGIGQIRGIAP